MLNSLWDFFREPFKPFYMWLLIFINLAGSLYGYYWYSGQLAETPWYYWPFTPDSPLSSTLLAVMLLLFLFGKRPNLFALIACAVVIKYGIWAVIINADFWRITGGVTPTTLMLAVSHLGMAIEGFIYLRQLEVTNSEIGFLAAWLALNDWLDYGIGIHPYLFNDTQLFLALSSAVVLSLSLIAYAFTRRHSPLRL